MGKIHGTVASLVSDGNPYIEMKTKNERWFICRYNPDDHTFKKELNLEGGIREVHRANALKQIKLLGAQCCF